MHAYPLVPPVVSAILCRSSKGGGPGRFTAGRDAALRRLGGETSADCSALDMRLYDDAQSVRASVE